MANIFIAWLTQWLTDVPASLCGSSDWGGWWVDHWYRLWLIRPVNMSVGTCHKLSLYFHIQRAGGLLRLTVWKYKNLMVEPH